jgi:uncharacterized DUF497 family protein
MYDLRVRFEWDPDKAALNLKRHKVSYNLIGLSSRRLLFVVYTQPEEDVTRLISARKAEKKHRRIYASPP